ncbi:MAG: alpha/beta hydrolase [Lentisphaerae bacterium]|nr:alpha/beta hydrolase [Lentisphaerota bacterium]
MNKATSFKKRGGLLRLSLLLLAALPQIAGAQETMFLYADKIPNAKVQEAPENDGALTDGMARSVIRPSMEIFLPEKENATGAAVVICPGGGYSVIVFEGEGVSTAKEFTKRGIAAFVLKYRLPSDSIMDDKTIGPLQDVQQAIKLVRENAEKWGIDKNKIGIMGFSAGGHLAATAATHYKKALIPNEENTSLRPDFQILVYPVVTMQNALTHKGSQQALLGNNPSKETLDLFSNELQVDDNTPPAYLTHATDDTTVDVDNTINYFKQLRKNKVPVEMHIYQQGNHGFVFGRPGWMEPIFDWMKQSKWID